VNSIILAATTNWLLKPFAWLLGVIFEGLFFVIQQLTTNQCLAITIILFTLLVRALMMPLMLSQQRSSRRMTRLQPKVEKIQNKYKGKTDVESQQKMNAEVQELYKANKANPASGCLPLLIQMPILFALFEVLRNVPFYVSEIGNLYETIAEMFMQNSNYVDIINSDTFSSAVSGLRNFDATTTDGVIDFLYHLSTSQWESLIETVPLTGETFTNAYELLVKYNTFGISPFIANLSENPGWTSWKIIFPLVSGATTFLSSWLSQRANEKRQKMANPNAVQTQQQQSMKMMTYIFPFMTAWFTASMPLGLGLYWIASNLFGIFSQWLSDQIIDREEYKEALKHLEELEERKKTRDEERVIAEKNKTGRLQGANVQSKAALAGGRANKPKQNLPSLSQQNDALKQQAVDVEAVEVTDAAENAGDAAAEAVTETADAVETAVETAEKKTPSVDEIFASMEAELRAKKEAAEAEEEEGES